MFQIRKRNRISLSFCLLTLLSILSLHPVSVQAQDITLDVGITYAKRGDVELHLDLARPSESKGPSPALIFLYGSAWGYMDTSQFLFAIRKAARNGYVAIAPEYRSAGATQQGKSRSAFPDQVYDVKCAVRWLYANAEKYNIDSSRIGAVGLSSGAELALMLGLTKPSDGLEGECENQQYPSKVIAVVNMEGRTELISAYRAGDASDVIAQYIGGSPEEMPEQYRKASPITYVSKDAPPILTIQGDRDTEVPLYQAELLDKTMKAVGAAHTLIVKKGYGHGNLWYWYEDVIWEFLDKHLKTSAGH